MRRQSIVAAAFALATLPCAHAGAQKPVTPDFIVNRASKMDPARWMIWIKDHDLLLADETGKTGGVIDLDASTQKKTHIGDASTLQSLASTGGPKLEKLGPPDAVDQTGKYFGYGYGQGFFVLDIAANHFHRTNAPESAEEFHFSPDGNWISCVSGHDLYVVSATSDERKRITDTGKPNLLNGTMTWVYWEEIYDHDSSASWWSPDSKRIAFFETDESPVPVTTYVNYNTQYATASTQCYPKPGHENPIVRLKVADIETGKIQTVPLVTNQEYIVGVKWGDADKLLFQTFNREQTEARYNMYEPATEKLATITTDANNWLDVNTDFDLIDGGASLLFASARSGFNHYYKVRVSGGTPAPITQGKWRIESNVEGATAVQNLDKRNGRILFTCTKNSFLERQVYSVDTNGSNLKQITKGYGYHYILASNDGQYFTDEYSNTYTPARTRLWTVTGKPLDIVDAAHPEIYNEIFRSKEKFVTVVARDGFNLPAKIRMPRNMVPGKRYPVIMHVYGGPEQPMVTARFPFFWAQDQLLADNGYIVVSADCRTAMVLDETVLAKNRGHLYGAPERNDFVDVVHWIKKQPYVDPNRVGIWGWSGGGGNTLNMLCHTKEFKAGIAGAPYVDPAFYDTFYSEHLFGLPKDNPSGYQEAAVWRYAKDLHGKLLLMWGSGDDNVQQQHELNFVNACIDSGKQVQLLLFPNRKHGLGDAAAVKYEIQAMLDFWKANL